ncbi:hypothetical protein OHV05_35140 (plasmid) [Kitasatospora sp. NBC_00070]|uniref:hypothetical protein n=1 Tax=Kitasatospora sp. NBC_00070 TaxID=2975962 RepID=UPI002F90C735
MAINLWPTTGPTTPAVETPAFDTETSPRTGRRRGKRTLATLLTGAIAVSGAALLAPSSASATTGAAYNPCPNGAAATYPSANTVSCAKTSYDGGSYTVPAGATATVQFEAYGERGKPGRDGYGMEAGHRGDGGKVTVTYTVPGGTQIDFRKISGGGVHETWDHKWEAGAGGTAIAASVQGQDLWVAGGGGGPGLENTTFRQGFDVGQSGNTLNNWGQNGGAGTPNWNNTSFGGGGGAGQWGGDGGHMENGGNRAGNAGSSYSAASIGSVQRVGGDSRAASFTDGAHTDMTITQLTFPALNTMPNYNASGHLNLTDLASNSTYSTGTSIANARTLVMQGDGNLVMTNLGGQAVWASDTWGNYGATASFANGILKIKKSVANGGTTLRQSNPNATAGALGFFPSGDLSITNFAQTPWTSQNEGLYFPADTLPNYQASGIAQSSTPLVTGQTYSFGTHDANGNTMGMLKMQGDGNLLAYNVNTDGTQGSLLWSSGTWGNNGATATFGTDGVLRIKNGSTEIWHSEGAAGDKLRVNSGYIRTTDTTGKITWAGDVLLRGDTLATGGTVTTGDVNHGNGYRLSMQGDGNLVLYTGNYSSAPWATATSGGTNTATFNTNGNLTVNGTAWTANLGTATRLALQGDGNLVAYNTSNQATWTR